MMRLRSVVRDVVLLGLAVAIGWWVRGAGTTVLAQRSGSSSSHGSDGGAGSEASMAFQMMGAGPNAGLAVYNPANRTLYVYNHVGDGNSEVNCSFSYAIPTPGKMIHRENCPIGELK